MSEVDVAALRDHWEDEKRIGQYFREHVEGEAEAVLALLAEIEGLRERLARQDAVIEAATKLSDWQFHEGATDLEWKLVSSSLNHELRLAIGLPASPPETSE